MCNLGASDIDSRLEEQLIDGILYAFQEQTNEVSSLPLSLIIPITSLISLFLHPFPSVCLPLPLSIPPPSIPLFHMFFSLLNFFSLWSFRML